MMLSCLEATIYNVIVIAIIKQLILDCDWLTAYNIGEATVGARADNK